MCSQKKAEGSQHGPLNLSPPGPRRRWLPYVNRLYKCVTGYTALPAPCHSAMRYLLAAALLILFPALASAQNLSEPPTAPLVVTADIDRFWEAYDQIVAEPDSAEQARILDSLFVQRGTPGLRAMIERRSLAPAAYVGAIRQYPRFWASVRPNMVRADGYAGEIAAGIDSLRVLYPDLRPVRVYFTVGALRTNGMTLDDVVFIGSELALADSTTVTDEFPERLGHLPAFFATNPAASVAFLNVHEVVHTQQGPFGDDLLAMVLQEGVAEFVAALATGEASPAPAVAFGEANEDRVREAFALDMFGSFTSPWLWSNAENDFGVRDLGYYVGYAIAEHYYERAEDKVQAVADLIGLDYQNPAAVDALVTASGYFDQPVGEMRAEAPRVVRIGGMENGAQDLAPGPRTLTVEFSRPVDPRFRGFDYGPLGPYHALRIERVVGLSEDGRRLTVEVNLVPEHRHQTLITSGFRSPEGVRLVPYLMDVTTGPAE